MNAPTPSTTRHDTSGRGTTSAASETTANRIATKSSGGTPCMPQSMTTKLKPHRLATVAANSMSRLLMAPSNPKIFGNTSDDFSG